MMQSNNQSQRGAMALNIILVIMLIIIGVLIYLLAGGEMPRIGKTRGVDSPETLTTADDAPTLRTQAGFTDGLTNPVSVSRGTLDEFGAGIAETSVYEIDINDDGRPDRITRTRHETGTDHFYDEYKIEINHGGRYSDITPSGFRTTEGAECALQKLQFSFRPDFRVVKISRPWQDTWTTPTMATKTTYAFVGDELRATGSEQMKVVCEVSDLF